MFELGDFLREFRKSRGLSYANFSRDYFDGELSPQTLKNLETGMGEPRISTLRVISEKLGVSLHLLAHAAFSLPEPEESGEYEGALSRLCALACEMPEDKRRQVLAFARFISRDVEPEEDLEPELSQTRTEQSSKAGMPTRKPPQSYIIEELEKLEEDWRKTVEEDNPFA